ncbi:MAG: tol-pal system-associated acyl-CoA thioesterase [Rhodobacteraceae bacterium]|nr:tol-pal system-associated acyl-CoA thioesterase [Paracoccaceae bacterium]
MTHRFETRVYYEDTDMAGIVYYANYLKFIERARSTIVREAGIDQGALKTDRGLVFAVRQVQATYLRPARFDDALTIVTDLEQSGRTRIIFFQDVFRGEEALFASEITVVCLTDSGKPARFPAEIRAKLGL